MVVISGDLFLISINDGRDTNAEVIAYENEYGGPSNHAPAVGMGGGCEAVANNFGINGYPSYLLISPDNVGQGLLSRCSSAFYNFKAEFIFRKLLYLIVNSARKVF